ncbi:MAG: hypothetical protein Pars93KO_26940 [Parasphingorhabdus sp.]
MPHILKNENLEVHIDLPNENYQSSRFDWTGKIQSVYFQGIPFSITEKNDHQNEHLFGKGFYNEFGIETALGFEEAEIGEWFHKIGIGLLKKNESDYYFHKELEIKPAEFSVNANPACIEIVCASEALNGYTYILFKKIELLENGFLVSYTLENTGEKDIITDEYTHNFLSINNQPVSPNYALSFPFALMSSEFEELVDPEEKIILGETKVSFSGKTTDQFFIGRLAGNQSTRAQWELINSSQKIGIREIASFQAQKVNLWGWKHVISPELFHNIHLKPGELTKWNRRYQIFRID